MNSVFADALLFNQELSSWDTSRVQTFIRSSLAPRNLIRTLALGIPVRLWTWTEYFVGRALPISISVPGTQASLPPSFHIFWSDFVQPRNQQLGYEQRH